MNDQKPVSDLSVTTFSTVVIHKDKLLETLVSNRDKHNSVYSAAVEGYWIESSKILDQKKVEFDEAISKANYQFGQYRDRLGVDFTHQLTGLCALADEKDKNRLPGQFSISTSFSHTLSFNPYWSLKFPENHLEDYDRVIDLLKYSVADKVELSSTDFDAYVRNNWAWRKSFLNTNTSYATSYCLSSTGFALGNLAISGCVGTLNNIVLASGMAGGNYGRYVSDTLEKSF